MLSYDHYSMLQNYIGKKDAQVVFLILDTLDVFFCKRIFFVKEFQKQGLRRTKKYLKVKQQKPQVAKKHEIKIEVSDSSTISRYT